MTFSRTSDFADENATIGDNSLSKRFDFYTSVLSDSHVLSILLYMPRLNKTNNSAFDHTDNGDQPAQPLMTSTFVMSTSTMLDFLWWGSIVILVQVQFEPKKRSEYNTIRKKIIVPAN